MYARKAGAAALKIKFLLGEYSAMGSLDKTRQEDDLIVACKVRDRQGENVLVQESPVSGGRWFPNQNRSTTSTVYCRSSNLGIRAEPKYPAPPAMRSFIFYCLSLVIFNERFLTADFGTGTVREIG